MLKLIYGCPGSGKSSRIAEKIASCLQEGKQVILLVPERFSVSAEQAVTAVCREKGVGNAMNLDILSFKRLCNRVFREYGGLCANYAGKGGRILTMYRALREVRAQLTTYQRLDLRDAGTVEAMLESVVSFKRSALSPEDFEKAARAAGENVLLCRKMQDLAIIWKAYDRLLSQRYDDPEEDLTRLAETLRKQPFFTDKEVFVDSFSALTNQEAEILSCAIEQSPSVTVALGFLPEDDRAIFQRLRLIEQKLIGFSEKARVGCVVDAVLKTPYGKRYDLAALEKNLFSEDGGMRRQEDTPDVSVSQFPSIYEECKAIAARILRDVHNGGRFSEHTVAARDVGVLSGILDQVFEANGVPYTLKKSVRFSDTCAGRLLLSALRLHNGRFRLEDMISYLKTGLSGLKEEECFLLEDYANLWQIEGRKRWFSPFAMNPEGHNALRSPAGEEKLETINLLRQRLITPLQQFAEDADACRTVEEFAVVLFDFVRSVGLEQALRRAENENRQAGDGLGAQICRQSFRALCQALDELVQACPRMPCTGEEFAQMLGIVFDKKELAGIPAGKDRVLISGAFDLKPGGVKTLHACCVNEGIFPAFSGAGGVFTAREKKQLQELQIDLPADDRVIPDEQYVCYSVLTLPGQKLYVTCHKRDLRGNPAKPSDLFEEICAFKGVTPEDAAEFPAHEDLLYGRANLLERALQNRRDEQTKALRALFETRHKNRFEDLKRSPLIFASDALSEAAVARAYPAGPIRLSQSGIEDFVNCPFSYTCKHLLHLREEPSGDVGSDEIGTVVHAVFERMIGDCIESGTSFGSLSDREIVDRVRDVTDTMEKQMLGQGGEDLFMHLLLGRVRSAAEVLCMNLRDEFAQSRFRPVFCELPFGLPGRGGFSLPAVTLRGETPVILRGVADRVDAFCSDDAVYLRVVDYKTGSKTFVPDALDEGLSAQMMLYLKVLTQTTDPAFLQRIGVQGAPARKVLPAGVLYFIAKSSAVKETGNDPAAIYDKISRSITRSGLLLDDPTVLRAMEKDLSGRFIPYKAGKDPGDKVVDARGFDEKLQGLDRTITGLAARMKRGEAAVTPQKKTKTKNGCFYCPMGPVCRKAGKEAIAEEGGSEE